MIERRKKTPRASVIEPAQEPDLMRMRSVARQAMDGLLSGRITDEEQVEKTRKLLQTLRDNDKLSSRTRARICDTLLRHHLQTVKLAVDTASDIHRMAERDADRHALPPQVQVPSAGENQGDEPGYRVTISILPPKTTHPADLKR